MCSSYPPLILILPCQSVRFSALSSPPGVQPSWCSAKEMGAVLLGHTAAWLLVCFLMNSKMEFTFWNLLQVQVWWIWTCPCKHWQIRLSTVQHQVPAKLVLSVFGSLASYQEGQLSAAAKDSTHKGVFKSFSPTLLPLCLQMPCRLYTRKSQ